MQVFVKRADLTTTPAPDPLLVVASYLADSPPVPYTAHGDPADVTVIYVPTTAVLQDRLILPGNIIVPRTILDPDWRSNVERIINSEANRRIEEVFPDYKQRNSTATYQQCLTAYGNDPNIWPIEAKDFKNEYDRGWAYINAVRERTTALITSLPPDPSADAHWPTRIDPVHFVPIF